MKTKAFDVVKMMRELRDKLSEDMERMTPTERAQYIQERAASTEVGRKVLEGSGNGKADDASHRR